MQVCLDMLRHVYSCNLPKYCPIGNDEEDEEDLAESLSVGRRASRAASASSFVLSAGSNRAGNDEEDEA